MCVFPLLTLLTTRTDLRPPVEPSKGHSPMSLSSSETFQALHWFVRIPPERSPGDAVDFGGRLLVKSAHR